MRWLLLAEVEVEDQEEEDYGKRQQEGPGEILAEEVVGEPEEEIILKEIYHLINVEEMQPEIEEEEEGEVRDCSAADKELLRLED